MKYQNIIIAAVLIIVFGVLGYWLGARGDYTSSAGSMETNTSHSNGAANTSPQIDYSEVLEDIKAQIKMNPNEWLLYAKAGDTLFGLRRFNEAIDYFKKATELNPGDANLYNTLALSYHYTGNTVQGLKYVDLALAASPVDPRIWLTRGFILGFKGDMAGAIEALKKAEKLDPTGGIGQAARGYIVEFEKAEKKDSATSKTVKEYAEEYKDKK
ncbi:MAG: tetratricopeptide repeat protein [Deltaproteobacteria bacterium]|nr:tetratricopeptide repeat protein [Deltaproteobacteria bacterium]